MLIIEKSQVGAQFYEEEIMENSLLSKEYLTLEEVEKLYSIKKNTLYKWLLKSSKYEVFKSRCVSRKGRRVLINRREFDVYMRGEER